MPELHTEAKKNWKRLGLKITTTGPLSSTAAFRRERERESTKNASERI